MFISTGDQQILMISMLMKNWRGHGAGHYLRLIRSRHMRLVLVLVYFTVRNEFSVENEDENELRKTSKIRVSCSCSFNRKESFTSAGVACVGKIG